jgi:hypothetical protein
MTAPQLNAGGWIQVRDYVPPDLCAEWTSAILGNRAGWTKRLGGYSYGRGWYLDIECGLLHQYHANAARANELVSSTLHGFFDRLSAFAAHLVAPDGSVGLPARPRRENLGPFWCDAGVHILGGDSGTEYAGGAPHADYEGLAPYVPALFDQATRAYSAILAVATPESGMGLDVWTHRRYMANTRPGPEVRTLMPVALEYEVGTMTALDSFLYHRIQPGRYSADRPCRIVGVIHFFYRAQPFPHWEHWF